MAYCIGLTHLQHPFFHKLLLLFDANLLIVIYQFLYVLFLVFLLSGGKCLTFFYVRGDVHTQFFTQNVKMTFSVQPVHPPLKTSGVAKYFFCCKTSYIGTIGNRNCKRPTYYAMITLFDQNRKYGNQNNKILHIVSHMALQAAPVIRTTEPSNSVPGSFDRHAQHLTADNFEIIWNLDKVLMHIMRYNICDCTWK